ncbi:hypothetical protein [Veronia pacifica]|uniref:Uncharacterized protein n=1 Tax=Veronia pacifica TaxID=1080227 RepID=A0A1C3EMA1_9GAMM|nr:hypothetical protein [Veronia pacifica]ODA34349.1 hypothetical protein A8L45_06390 [Veronia pacifica]
MKKWPSISKGISVLMLLHCYQLQAQPSLIQEEQGVLIGKWHCVAKMDGEKPISFDGVTDYLSNGTFLSEVKTVANLPGLEISISFNVSSNGNWKRQQQLLNESTIRYSVTGNNAISDKFAPLMETRLPSGAKWTLSWLNDGSMIKIGNNGLRHNCKKVGSAEQFTKVQENPALARGKLE